MLKSLCADCCADLCEWLLQGEPMPGQQVIRADNGTYFTLSCPDYISPHGTEPPPRPWTAEDNSKLIRLYRTGMSYPMISAEMQRSLGACLSHATEMDLPRIYGKERNANGGRVNNCKPDYTQEEDRKIIEMHLNGRSWREIAQELGRSENAVKIHAAKLAPIKQKRQRKKQR